MSRSTVCCCCFYYTKSSLDGQTYYVMCAFVHQDTNENYDLPVIREFNDIYYYTQEGGLSAPAPPVFDPFRPDPLPEIATDDRLGSRKGSDSTSRDGSQSSRPATFRGLSNHQMSNLFKKVCLLNTCLAKT